MTTDKRHLDLAQSLRRSHCARGDDEHECAGTCTITPRGVELDCKLCGAGGLDAIPFGRREIERAKRILHVAGLDYDALSVDRQRELMVEFLRDVCPGCGAVARIHSDDAYSAWHICGCELWVRKRGSWSKREGSAS